MEAPARLLGESSNYYSLDASLWRRAPNRPETAAAVGKREIRADATVRAVLGMVASITMSVHRQHVFVVAQAIESIGLPASIIQESPRRRDLSRRYVSTNGDWSTPSW
jgi:hypothetical protein